MYRYYQSVSENLVEHQTGGPSLGWLYQTLLETRRLSKLNSPSIPCLTFIGAEDTIVARDSVISRMEHWDNGSLRIVDEARHDVFYEVPTIRKKAFKELIDLFDTHT